ELDGGIGTGSGLFDLHATLRIVAGRRSQSVDVPERVQAARRVLRLAQRGELTLERGPDDLAVVRRAHVTARVLIARCANDEDAGRLGAFVRIGKRDPARGGDRRPRQRGEEGFSHAEGEPSLQDVEALVERGVPVERRPASRLDYRLDDGERAVALV